jgi:hypothetical protein
MKVITQLIRHFWERGALTPLEVAYLLRHGYCRQKDVPGFKSPRAGTLEATADVPSAPIQLPDALELVEESLVRRTAGRRADRQPKAKMLSEKELRRRLNAEYSQREQDLASVLAFGRRFAEVQSWAEAASQLHAVTPDRFHRGLRGGLHDESILIGDLWQASDPEPFHKFTDTDDFRGRLARAFHAVLLASGLANLGSFAWILKYDEVQALVNLMVVHHRLLGSLHRLYKRDRLMLSRALGKNNDAAQVWSLVILYNSHRNPKLGAQPDYGNEYGPVAPPPFAVWKRAWTSALFMDRAGVTKFLAACYEGSTSEDVEDGACCQRPLMCPVAWNIPSVA